MIVEFYNSDHSYTAVVQAEARVELRDRSYGRSLLEGVVRELVEHQLHQALRDLNREAFELALASKSEELERTVGSELDRRNIDLHELKLRLVWLGEPDQVRPPGTYNWVEFQSSDIGTGDGFQVVVDSVALVGPLRPRAHFEPRQTQRLVQHCLGEVFGLGLTGLSLEDILVGRVTWTQRAVGQAGRALARAGLELRNLAVTEVRARPGKTAFRPPTTGGADFASGLRIQPMADLTREPLSEEEG